MATSETLICNLALQKLGQTRIVNRSEDSASARLCNEVFDIVRDQVLRANKWKFALKRTTLAPSSTEPDFFYEHAFVLPADCLRAIFPPRHDLDWKVENHEGSPAILTNQGDTLELRYIARITDPTLFDPLFVDAFACKLAWQLCETITQSTSKKTDVSNEYAFSIREAKRINAIEIGHLIQPIDEWTLGRLNGQLVNNEWRQE